MTLVGPDRGEPELSVVMVTYGAWELTRSALAALMENTEAQFELIVVDNGSEAPMRQWLSGLENVRVIFNERNRGFGPATNQGAEHARAEFLLLLNSDALVPSGWLPPLLAAAAYSWGCRNPTGFPSDWLSRAVSPAHSGATALVPPITWAWPSTSTW